MQAVPQEEVTIPRRSTRVYKPVIRKDFITYLMSVDSDNTLTTEEALNSPDAEKWIQALKEEYQALL